jgi:hypothetical protein
MVHLTLEVSIPEGASLFQALVLAFWKFQQIFATTVFTKVLESIQELAVTELEAAHPGRFRDKGTVKRTWHLPFGSVDFGLRKLRDRETGKVFGPLRLAMEIPDRVRWCEDTLVPGFHLTMIQSFRKSARALRSGSPDHRGPDHRTLHRRFMDFAGKLDPVPDLTHRSGPKPSAHQQADGTKLKLQNRGHDAGSADLRIVVGSRTPHGTMEVLGFAVGDTWEQIAERVRAKFPTPPSVLVTDGEEEIPVALCGPDTLHQRCLVHGRRNLPYALYQDGIKGKRQIPIKNAFGGIPALQLCQEELRTLTRNDGESILDLIAATRTAVDRILEKLPEDRYPSTRTYVLNLIQDGLTYLRHLIDHRGEILLSTNRTENTIGQLTIRLKKIGKRWSAKGGAAMVGACLTYALHPDRHDQIERAARGELLPKVSILITSLETAWSC